MHLLITDETNNTPTDKVRFFVYGGLTVAAEQVHPLTVRIEEIRVEAGLAPGDALKFDTNSRPKHVPIEVYTKAKNDVIEAAHAAGCHFISCLVLHDIAVQKPEVKITWGLNTVLSVFNFKYLVGQNDTGIVIIDRPPFDSYYDTLRGKFSVGLIFPGGRTSRLTRVDLFAATCDGASHLSSATDIVLGAFRYCVNHPGGGDVPKQLFPMIARMLYSRLEGQKRYVNEYGITFRPKNIRVEAYQQEYDALVTRFVEYMRG